MRGQHQVEPGIGLDEDRVGQIETRGVDTIPIEERTSSPRNLFWIMVGGNMTFGIILFGWLPIADGLGWWSAVSSITVGLVLGTLIFAPTALLGTRTGTNGAVSSGAHFGVVGRIIGSAIALFTAVGFTALTVWTGGEAAVSGGHRLFGLPSSNVSLAVAYALISAIILAVGIYGHATVVAMQKFVAVPVVVLLLIGFVTLGSHFHAGYAGGHYILGGFWATWVLSVVTAASLPISYSPFINDYARYVSPRRFSQRAIMAGAGLGGFVGLWFGLVFAAYAASTFANPSTDFVSGLIAASPTWYVALIMAVGLLGSLSQGALATYGTGLDFSSLFPALPRVAATVIISLIVITLVFLGTLVWNAVNTVNAFVTLLLVVTTPWVAILIIGYVRRQGHYWESDLQVFNRRERGGRYWYLGGWNPRAVIAWVVASAVGLMFASTSLYVGPWSDLAGGVDLSFVSAGVLGALLYGGMLVAFPERIDPPAHDAVTRALAGEAPAPAPAPVPAD